MTSDAIDLIPALPYDIALDCLLRQPPSAYGTLRQVSTSWKSAVSTAAFFSLRRRLGYAHQYACFVHPVQEPNSPAKKAPHHAITACDAATDTWQRLPPIPELADVGIPYFCQLASTGAELILLGGWHPVTFAVLTSVYVYNFLSATWRRAADMPTARSFFSAASLGRRILVVGGHDGEKNALRAAEIYDVDGDAWSTLPELCEERDECKAVVLGGKFAVISGYSTTNQGIFMNSAEILDKECRQWTRVDNMWPHKSSPNSLFAHNGRLYFFVDRKLVTYSPLKNAWEEVVPTDPIQSASCAIPLSDTSILVCGHGGGVDNYHTFICCLPSSNGVQKCLAKTSPCKRVDNGFFSSACFIEV